MKSLVNDFIREKICFYSPLPWANSYMELMKEASKIGLRGVELLNYGELSTPDMAAARELGKYAKENGLLIPCCSVGMNLVGDDRAEKIADIKKYAEICSELEIPYLHHTVAFGLKKRPIEEVELAFNRGVEATLEIAEYANKLGVKTVLEDQGFVVNGVENYGRFRRASGNVFDVLLDVGNIYFVDETAGAFAESFATDIVHTHVKEYHYTKNEPDGGAQYTTFEGNYLTNAIAGEGDVDYGRVKTALKDVNYKGVYSMEYTLKNTDELNRTFEYLASVFGDM